MRFIDILNKDRERIGLDTVVYTNKTIDEVAYIDSDGKEFTYRDIFETNQMLSNPYFEEGTNDWTIGAATGSVADGIYSFLATAQFGKIYQIVNTSVDKNYYFAAGVKNDRIYASLYPFGLLGADHSGSGDWEDLSVVVTATGATIDLRVHDYGTADWTEIQVNYVLAVDLSMFISSPSQPQLDIMRDVFLARRNITKETYTLRELMLLQEDVSTVNQMTLVDDVWEQTMSANVITDNYSNQILTPYEKYYIKLQINYDDPTSITFFKWYDSIEWNESNSAPPQDFSFIKTIGNYARIAFGSTSNIIQKQYVSDIFAINFKNFDEYMIKEHMDYIVALYKKVKYEEENSDKIYSKTGKSKFDVAYTNKTIDQPIAELNNYTLREIFEHGNLIGPTIEDNQKAYGDGGSLYENNNYGNIPFIENHIYYSSIDALFHDDTGNTTAVTVFYQISLDGLNRQFLHTSIFANGEDYFNRLSSLFEMEWPDETSYARIYTSFSVNMQIADYAQQKNVYFIDLTVFGLQALSAAEVDVYYEMYLARKDLEKIELTYSDIFEKYNLMQNSFFEEDKWDGYSIHDSTVTIQNNYIKYTADGINYIDTIFDDVFIKNNKYFIGLDVLYNTLITTFTYLRFQNVGTGIDGFVFLGETGKIQKVFTATLEGVPTNDNDLHMFVRPEEPIGNYIVLDYVVLLNLKIFDERITQTQIDLLLEEFKLIKNIIRIPEVFLITEPIGFGGRYKMLESDGYVYGHELDFENLGFKVNFGINYNAYEGFNLLQNHLKDNEGIIEYDWGKGSRYADVRLLRAPKTEKDTLSLIRSKYSFKMLNPFYELVIASFAASYEFEHSHPQPLLPILEITTSAAVMTLELEQDGVVIQEIRIDLDTTSLPATFTLDCEKKTILLDDGTNLYEYIDKQYQTFFEIPEGTGYEFVFSGQSGVKATLKKWVVD